MSHRAPVPPPRRWKPILKEVAFWVAFVLACIWLGYYFAVLA